MLNVGKKLEMKIIFSAGGTGGHIFPAIAVADELKRQMPNAEILFVGALGKMEMERVPTAGYKIEGLNIAGFQRKLSINNIWNNVKLPFKILDSMRTVRRIIKNFKPDVVAGFGGFASGPTLRAAAEMHIPTVLQEQNSYAGVTNKLLAKKARLICVAYEGLDKFFPANKIILTGNPVRADIINVTAKRKEGIIFFGLDSSKKTIFVSGGSLGARTLNNCIVQNVDFFKQHTEIQVIWQCGKIYFETLKTCESAQLPNVHLLPFVQRMDLAYAVADIVIARAGALTISELCLVGVPTILIPSPNVAEDHQTKNATALSKKDAAVLIPDSEAVEKTLPMVLNILNDSQSAQSMRYNILKFGKPEAAKDIVKAIISQTDVSR